MAHEDQCAGLRLRLRPGSQGSTPARSQEEKALGGWPLGFSGLWQRPQAPQGLARDSGEENPKILPDVPPSQILSFARVAKIFEFRESSALLPLAVAEACELLSGASQRLPVTCTSVPLLLPGPFLLLQDQSPPCAGAAPASEAYCIPEGKVSQPHSLSLKSHLLLLHRAMMEKSGPGGCLGSL